MFELYVKCVYVYNQSKVFKSKVFFNTDFKWQGKGETLLLVILLLEVNSRSRSLTVAIRKMLIIYKKNWCCSMPVETEQKLVSIAVGPLSTHRKEVRRVVGKTVLCSSSGWPVSDRGAGSLIFTCFLGSSESPLASDTALNNWVIQ